MSDPPRYYKLTDDGLSEKGRATEEERQTKRQEYQESKTAIEKNLLLGETEKAEWCRRAVYQLEVLDQQESEFQTDNGNSEKLTAELGINDKASNSQGAVRTQQELVTTGSTALEEAMDKVRKAEYRLGKQQQQKLQEKQQALEILLKEQKGINARMCQRLSGTMEAPTTQPRLPQDANPQHVWSFVQQLFGDPMFHEAFCWAIAGPFAREEPGKNRQYAQDMLQQTV